MKNLMKSSAILMLVLILVSFSSRKHELFNAFSFKLPSSFVVDDSEDYAFVDEENDVTLRFTLTENLQYGEFLPKVDFESLFDNHCPTDSTIITNKEIRHASGLKIGIFEQTTKLIEEKVVVFEARNEIIVGIITGETTNDDYLKEVLNQFVDSIKLL